MSKHRVLILFLALLVPAVLHAQPGPNDRLAQFDNQGLQCVNSSQGSGQSCQNYVVRFSCP